MPELRRGQSTLKGTKMPRPYSVKTKKVITKQQKFFSVLNELSIMSGNEKMTKHFMSCAL